MNSFDNIPQEMKALPNWVCFKFQPRGKDGKLSKVPYNPLTGKMAKSNDSSTWVSFADAAQHIDRFNGIGFQFDNSPYVGVDIDHCVKDGQWTQQAIQIVQALSSYTEYSPSGAGLHVICKGDLLQGGNRNDKIGLEIYKTGRYFTMTGNVLQGYERIIENPNAIAEVQREYIIEAKANSAQLSTSSIPATPQPCVQAAKETPDGINDIINRAAGSKQGFKFQNLYAGRWEGEYKSQSDADMAFCNMLAFWTGKDATMMDAIFRETGLMRPKWDEMRGADTYGNMTIDEAIAKCQKVYNPTYRKSADSEILDAQSLGDTWPETEVVEGKLQPIKMHWKNTEWLCDKLGIHFKYNLLTKEIDVDRADLRGKSLDAILAYVRGVCHKNGLKISRADLADNVGLIAEQNQFSPVVDYLNDCMLKWDGKSRIEQLFNCFKLDGSIQQDEDFLRVLFEKWLLSCVKMAFNNGTEAAQGLLVLRGAQGIGKTRFLYAILPYPEWGADGITLDPTVKDDILKVMRFWIVELGEINDTLRKEKLDRLKSFVTSRTDNLRKPYKRASEEMPRRTVFIGTVNGEGFLKDATGERRYWVIAVKSVEGDPTLDISQLWGEVTHKAMVQKMPHWLTPEQIKQLNEQNEAYKKLTTEEQVLLDMLDWDAPEMCWQWITSTELTVAVGLPRTRNGLIGRALRRFADGSRTVGRGVIRPTNNMDKRYKVPPVKISKFSESYYQV